MTNETIVKHECGHLVALMAAGIYSEFTRISVGAAEHAGDRVNGLTERSGDSLMQYSFDLLNWSRRLGGGQAGVEDWVRFLAERGLAVCLPHVCYFYGGGAMDRSAGCEDAERNGIDTREIEAKVLPSLVITWNDDCNFLKERVYAFLESVFRREQSLITRICGELRENPVMEKGQMDALLEKDPDGGAEGVRRRAEGDYQTLLNDLREWYAGYLKAKFCPGIAQ